MNTTQLIIAITRGRILKEVLPLLEAAGIEPQEDMSASRKLIFDTGLENVKLMVLRGSDVPTCVEFGSADMGVVGKDVLLEYGSEGFYEPLDLKIARCRMMTARPVGQGTGQGTGQGAGQSTGQGVAQSTGQGKERGENRSHARIRVATKFTNIAKQYFAGQGQQIELIKLAGALELAPVLGLADTIVDIVDTGSTLKANGLEPHELIAHISSRVIVNKAAMKLKGQIINPTLDRLREAVRAQTI
ncbi:MAG: ATP phosphoribosyltransferase [Pseudohongiellaceae bacterium]